MFGDFCLLERRVALRFPSSRIRGFILAALVSPLCFQAKGQISLESYNHSKSVTWTVNGFDVSGELKPNLIFYENNQYLFAKSDSNSTSFYLSDSVGSEYAGSGVFNNGFSSFSEYLLLSPNPSASILYYYNPGDTVNFGQISIEPYEKFLKFPDAVNQKRILESVS